MELISILILVLSLLVGLSIGANSAANSIGVVVGSNLMPFRKAAVFTAVFILAGAVLQGGGVADTIGKELTTSEEGYGDEVIACALLASVIFLGIATAAAIPVATSHTVLGSILGAFVCAGLLGEVNAYILRDICVSWAVTPFAAMLLGYASYKYAMTPLSERLGILSFNRVFRVLILLGSVFLSYSIGANSAGNAIGPARASGIVHSPAALLALVGAIMGFGATAFSGGVVKTVGKKITHLAPPMAFAAQVGAGLTIYFFTLKHIPVSSTQAIVGAVLGVGLTKGSKTVNSKTIRHIFIGWIVTPVASAAFSMLVYWLFFII